MGFRGWNAEAIDFYDGLEEEFFALAESLQEWLDTHVGPSRTA